VPSSQGVSDVSAGLVIAGLERIGYRGSLLERSYSFPDWFSNQQIRTLEAAAFGQTPASYESACIGVARANGLREHALANAYRAFGAPVLLEIDGDQVREWAISRFENQHTLVGHYRASELQTLISTRAREWAPESLLRAKSIGSFRWVEQLGLFAGLIPELESQIQEKLDPLLRETLSRTRAAYLESTRKSPDPQELFQLIFWTLTAKVFRDRQFGAFAELGADPDAIVAAVARHYRTDPPRLLNVHARAEAAASVWRGLDFRNLSVEVLAHIWSRTLVSPETRKRLGIHRTPRAIVRYIVERLPFTHVGDDDRVIFEPCSGSAAFLIGAVNYLRPNLFLASPQQRHEYFVKHLAGMESDPFGVEISKLALTLADYPNRNGWDIRSGDVFAPRAMTPLLKRAGVVLCNPPFEPLADSARQTYAASEIQKPAEILSRVLHDLHPSGVLGFVLPYVAVDGRSYATTRKRLAERFASIEITVLPERSFDDAEAAVAVLIAKEPIPHVSTRVSFSRVDDNPEAWDAFRLEHAVSTNYAENFTEDSARKGLIISELPDVWSYLTSHRTLEQVAEIHRGLEWSTPISQDHVRSKESNGFKLGVAPSTKFCAFQVPPLKYLDMRRPQQRRNSWKYAWNKPKAIMPKARVSRGRWRIVAFADRVGITCHHTFYGVWPKSEQYDELLLAAVLNGPVANAFVAVREGSRDVTAEVLRLIPVPTFSSTARTRLHDLIERYEASIQAVALDAPENPEYLLKQIDAAVLDAYRLPPKIEKTVLDFFNDNDRKVAHPFTNYFPATLDIFVSLSDFLSPKFSRATVGELLKKAQVG